MPVKMKPTSQIKLRLGINPSGRVQKFTTHTCRKHMDKYIPANEYNLRINVDEQPTYIVYESPYALAQYVGIVHGSEVKNYTTPGTGPYWDKRMVSAEMQDVVKEVQDYVNRGGK